MSSAPEPDHIYAAQWATGAASAEILLELMGGIDLSATVWEHVDEGHAMVSVYTTTAEEAAAAVEAVAAELPAWAELLPESVETRGVTPLAREDWAESWKRYFRPRQVSRRVVVVPSWEDHRVGPGQVAVEIDPGMSFGTGQHGTTAACIDLLDELAAAQGGAPLLDAGCGSGILSIAAAKLGYGPIVAFDYDPIAVEACLANCAANGVAATVSVEQADLITWQPPRRFPIVVANILATVLTANVAAVKATVAPGPASRLILSGILNEQFASVADAYSAVGFRLVGTRRIDEWTSGLFAWA